MMSTASPVRKTCATPGAGRNAPPRNGLDGLAAASAGAPSCAPGTGRPRNGQSAETPAAAAGSSVSFVPHHTPRRSFRNADSSRDRRVGRGTATGEGDGEDGERRARRLVFVRDAVRERQGVEPGGTARGGGGRVLRDGAEP